MPSTADRSWATGPRHPQLADGETHVWRADLTAGAADLVALLRTDERARAERFLRDGDRQRWMRARGVLRALLGRYTHKDRRALRFTVGPHGKPALLGAVGVDVELARRPIDEVAVATRALGPTEARRLEGLDPATRKREFLRAWVRHEAVLKCRGSGIGAASFAPSGVSPWLAELDVGAGAAAAVALERPPRDLRCWDWHSQPSAATG